MEYKLISPEYDAAVAHIIRRNLEAYGLNIQGTAYYDEALDHLSEYYEHPERAYYVLTDEGEVIGGVGFGECAFFDKCCELQKLYLKDSVKGRGLGYGMLDFIEERAAEKGYRRIYLETHHVLKTAIHVYERRGYLRIERPDSVVHSTMDRFFIKELRER
ncbi:MAG: GNAT family N-acetyltransferase [Lachnospiraceae bacterium]|nr:GNAT family N-acetyltransferase [Lachnospiraceae bacterium]